MQLEVQSRAQTSPNSLSCCRVRALSMPSVLLRAMCFLSVQHTELSLHAGQAEIVVEALDSGLTGPSASCRIVCAFALAELGLLQDSTVLPPGLEACLSRYKPALPRLTASESTAKAAVCLYQEEELAHLCAAYVSPSCKAHRHSTQPWSQYC